MFLAALEEVYEQPCSVAGYSFAGKTDPQIVLDLLTAAGFERQAILDRLPAMQQLYLRRIEEHLDHRRMRLLPWVEEVLQRLAGRRDLQLGLLTGNWQRGAMAKLGRFGLERHFPFGAFGDDAIDRPALLPVALDRAEHVSGRRFLFEETVIVGDSLLDVACGHAHGVAVLAVATGHTPGEALRASGAEWVVDDLLAAEVHLDTFAA